MEEEAYKPTQIMEYILPGTLKTSYTTGGDVHTPNISRGNSGNKTPLEKKKVMTPCFVIKAHNQHQFPVQLSFKIRINETFLILSNSKDIEQINLILF